jgi:hypothetical protein
MRILHPETGKSQHEWPDFSEKNAEMVENTQG